jgi:hypothetical protein
MNLAGFQRALFIPHESSAVRDVRSALSQATNFDRVSACGLFPRGNG